MSAEPENDPRAILAVVLPLLSAARDDWDSLFVGPPPEGWPRSLLPPAHVDTRGGVAFGEQIMAVFEYPPSTASPVFEYRDYIEANGWDPSERFDHGHNGFDDGRLALYERDGLTATVSSRPGTSVGRSVIVAVRAAVHSRHRDERIALMKDRLRFPRLLAPPDVVSSGGGSCGGGDHTTHNLRLRTDRAPGDLLDFFAQQLAERRWRLGPATITDSTATQWLEVDYQDAVWRGVLGVFANGSVRDIFIHIAQAPV